MRCPNCAECTRLLNDTATVLREYNAALDALSAIERFDPTYSDRWIELATVAERLSEAQGVEQVHHDSHHSLDLMPTRRSDRRVSLVRDRRRSARGGRRHTDNDWSSPPCNRSLSRTLDGEGGSYGISLPTAALQPSRIAAAASVTVQPNCGIINGHLRAVLATATPRL
jgi:hypothetical protein